MWKWPGPQRLLPGVQSWSERSGVNATVIACDSNGTVTVIASVQWPLLACEVERGGAWLSLTFERLKLTALLCPQTHEGAATCLGYTVYTLQSLQLYTRCAATAYGV